jgi:hypothetical protein
MRRDNIMRQFIVTSTVYDGSAWHRTTSVTTTTSHGSAMEIVQRHLEREYQLVAVGTCEAGALVAA